MTIPGRGDLSPPRRHRRGRRGRWPRVFLVLVLLAALAAGGWYGWRHWHNSDTAAVGTGTVGSGRGPCVSSPSRTPSPTPFGSAIRVLNASLRPGLAARVARALRRPPLAFRIVDVGNAARFQRCASVVRYPSTAADQARHLAVAVVPTARLAAASGVAKVELDLGGRFRGLVTATEYGAGRIRFAVLGRDTVADGFAVPPCLG